MSKPIIRIWETRSLGLIIARPTGVLVSNQTGGYMCLHPEVEGIYVPLALEYEELKRYFIGAKWRGWCSDGIDVETADFVDKFLGRSGNTNFITVNRERLKDSHEAWIHVHIEEPSGDPEVTLFTGFGKQEGVLTWENSD